MLLQILVLGSILFFLKVLIRVILQAHYCQKLPGPPRLNFIVGNIQHFSEDLDDVFQVLRKLGRSFSIYKLWAGWFVSAHMTSPEDIGLVLGDPIHNTKSKFYSMFHQWLKEGLLVSEGDKWMKRRKILTSAFHFNILQDFILSFNERTDQLVEILKSNQDKLEITELIPNLTMKVIAETAMGKKIDFDDEKGKNYKKCIHRLAEIGVYRLLRPHLILRNWLYYLTPTFFEELRVTKMLHNFTKEVILEREQEKNFNSGSTSSKKKRLAMLDLLFTVKEEGMIDDEGIREEVDTFMFEGHDTIASAMCFGLMILACHPQVQEQIVEEMQQVLGDVRKKPNYHDLQELKYMERCIKEILRMFPPVLIMSRVLGEDLVTHSGFKIKKDTTVFVHIYDVHHNPEIYPEPEKFDPDRFLPEVSKNRHPYAFIPFSAGPRNCIGQKFAMLELKAFFCGILGNFVLEPVDTPDSLVLMEYFVLRSKEGIKLKFISREG